MKSKGKILSITLSCALATIGAIGLASCGEKIEEGANQGLKYALSDDGTYYVSDIGSCIDVDIVISSTYNDVPVTSIDESAFFTPQLNRERQ